MKENRLTDRKGDLCPGFSSSVVHTGNIIDTHKIIAHIACFLQMN